MASFKRLPPFRLQTSSKRSSGDDANCDSSLLLYNKRTQQLVHSRSDDDFDSQKSYSADDDRSGSDRESDYYESENDRWEEFEDRNRDEERGGRGNIRFNRGRSAERDAVQSYPANSNAQVPLKNIIARHSGYRIPGRIMRFLCLALALMVFGFIGVLVRASVTENRSLQNGTHKVQIGKTPVWELWPKLTRYYGGLKTLRSLDDVVPQYPYNLDQNSNHARDTEGYGTVSYEFTSDVLKTPDMKQCYIDAAGKAKVPGLHVFNGRPYGFPNHAAGSYKLFNLPEDVCFDRYGRYAPYGLGYSTREGGLSAGQYGHTEGIEAIWNSTGKVNWNKVDWADVQRRCYQRNIDLFNVSKTLEPEPEGFFVGNSTKGNPLVSKGKLSRTAIVLRAWDEYHWTVNDILNLRALISEVSLASGGQYDVHILVQVKDEAAHPIWADAEAYQQRIVDSIPAEFRGLTTLWSQTQMLNVYQGLHDDFPKGPDLPVHGVYRGLQMPMQWFASRHPEYKFFWQWEMDLNYVGHYLEFFKRIEQWSLKQPRRGIWERNARFYVPHVHGSYEQFAKLAESQTTEGVSMPGGRKVNTGERLVWGPKRPLDPEDWFEYENDPTPPLHDDKTWGVDEEADLITLSPMFDPEKTIWGLANDITGYHTDRGYPPRRAFITAASRMSRRLIDTMHRETAYKKHFAFPEMWPSTVALQHGYKAVYAPHPMFVDRAWDLETFANTINRGKNGASGGSSNSIFGNQEQSLETMTFFYRSGFSGNLYRAWLGLRSQYTSGQQFELETDETKTGADIENLRGGEGRMCLPPVLLHPIKDVDIPIEAVAEETKQEEEFDAGS